ncbi:MAG: coproporphyrinogen III oxidase family protein [bacterium]|nr:coproporphyrinogen III oxidase family protein [bacterium]
MAGGLYVHLPFCASVCPYCDYPVCAVGDTNLSAFVDDVLREAELHASEEPGFDTLYLGGGTPSLIPDDSLMRLLAGLRSTLDVLPSARTFLEVNPEDVTAERLRLWREADVHTVVLGIQSFDDAVLERLGRRHRAVQSYAAVENASSAGFDCVSIDLVYGDELYDIPSWSGALREACALRPHHVSCYELTAAEGGPGSREHAGLFRTTHETLEGAGLRAYSVCSFAAGPEHRSRHNEKYWTLQPHLGLGPSAHSFREPVRRWNVASPRDWSAAVRSGRPATADSETLTPRQLATEALMLGLRTRAGVDPVAIRERFGVDLVAPNRALLERLAGEGLLEGSLVGWAPTRAGLAVADALAARFSVGEDA